tara:strand:- start:157 stop:336 length:180 start_codon:yes stop_codon:yes gene_type:complete
MFRSGRKAGDFCFKWLNLKTVTSVGYFGDPECPRKIAAEPVNIVFPPKELLVDGVDLGK